MQKPQIFKKESMLTVAQVAKELNNCSRRHVYNLIERGDIKPAFRYGRRRGVCVPIEAVAEFKLRSQIEVGK